MQRWLRILRSRISPKFIGVDLYSVLHNANADSTLEEKIAWFESLMEWVRLPASPEAVAQKTVRIEAARVRFLLHMLERKPELKVKAAETLQSILLESDAVELYFGVGIELQYGFVRELVDRTVANFIPEYREANSLKQTFEKIFATEEDVQWLRDLSAKDLEQIMSLVLADPVARATFRAKQMDAIRSALQMLSSRVVGLSVEQDLRVRLPTRDVRQSPLFQLQQSMFSPTAMSADASFTHLRGVLQLCWKEIEGVYPILETAGLSVDLVYKLDTVKSILRRMDLLLTLFRQTQSGQVSSQDCVRFAAELAQLHVERASLTAFLSSSLNLVSRKITERTSVSGEHYITRNKAEYREMFGSAAGGGFLTLFTIVIKTATSKLHLPLFFDGLFSSLNYALSFSLIQIFHFTLATKMPAVTASTMASKLRDLSNEEKIKEFVEEVVCLHRSAFVAVLGNLGMVIPSVIVFDFLWRLMTGDHLFSSSYGLEQMRKHSPLHGFTILYAMITGFLLWFSSILGAWLENWFVYRRQFEVLEHSLPIRRFLGSARQKKWVDYIRHNIAGLGSNVFLGFLLAYCGIVGQFFGFPLDVRHVTLSTGTLTFGFLGIDNPSQHWFVILSAAFGIVVIATLNFSVSFVLSLFVAARARDIRLRNFPFLIGLIMDRYRTGFRDFYLPYRTSNKPH